jgi:hypothetical protein
VHFIWFRVGLLMFRRHALLKCRAAAAQTLTAWLTQLADEAEKLPAAVDAAAGAAAVSEKARALLRDIETAATHANALREADTLFAVLHCVLKKQHYPADVESWARLATQLLPYGGVEGRSVLCYPGHHLSSSTSSQGVSFSRSDGDVEGSAWGTTTSSTLSTPVSSCFGSAGSSQTHYRLPITRETLLMTGGVVPLSARVPCGDGRMVALFLDDFSSYIRAATAALSSQGRLSAATKSAVAAVSKSVLQTLSASAPTLQWELLMPSLLDYLQLLHELDMQSAVCVLRESKDRGEADVDASGEAVAAAGDEEEGTLESAVDTATQRTRFLTHMLNGLAHRTLKSGARGSRVALYYLNDAFADVVESFHASDVTALLSPEDVQKLYWAQQRRLISLTRSCMRALYLHYTPESASPARGGENSAPLRVDLVLAAPMNRKIESLYDQIDVLYQRNTNAGNPLQLSESIVSQLKDIHTLALLRALRIEEAAPDAYLRKALEVVDRVPPSMAVEAELIAGKVRLLDLDSDTVDDEGRTAVYKDLLASLRSLVEMRPRFTRQDGAAGTSAFTTSDGEEAQQPHHHEGETEGKISTTVSGDGADDGEDAAVRLDEVTQAILQRAHLDVITAFCAAHTDEWSNEAYNILVTHKYHGVKITKELILPVLQVFSRRGDCRAFNLVDMCVLYSNETVDMQTIALLFRTCAAAGDHYRARTFLQLLNEIIPGFLVKCPAAVTESLQELKLLDPPPRHLFVSAEDDMVQSALGEAAPTVRRLSDVA